ncbi:MAG: hypothetical protein QXV51_03185 [Thermosphaera sp.]
MQLTPRGLLVLSIFLLVLSIIFSLIGSLETVQMVEREKIIYVNETSYYTLSLLLRENIISEARGATISITNEGGASVEIMVFSNETLLYHVILNPDELKTFHLNGTNLQYNVIRLSSNGTLVRLSFTLEIPSMPFTEFSIASLIVLIIGTVLLIQYVAVKISLRTEK